MTVDTMLQPLSSPWPPLPEMQVTTAPTNGTGAWATYCAVMGAVFHSPHIKDLGPEQICRGCKLTEPLLVQSLRGEKADLAPKAVQAESRSRHSHSPWETKCDPRLSRCEQE